MKVHKKACHTVFGLEMAGRLVDNVFYVKLTKKQVRISLKRTFMYFPRFFIPPPLLKSSLKITFEGQTVIFYYYEIKRNCGEKEMFLSYYLPWCLTSI
jgi:hypothetical protein